MTPIPSVHSDAQEDTDDEERRRGRVQYPIIISSPSEWLTRYNQLLDGHPLRTKMVTSLFISAFGSALGSYLSNATKENQQRTNIMRRDNDAKSTNINWVDVLSFALHGCFVNAPISHFWFEWLSVNGPSSTTASTLVDQLVVQPPLLALMFVCLDVFRASIRATMHQFREGNVISKSITNAIKVIPSSWRFWPFAVYCTFKYLKKKHYTVALNLCSVAWTVYLSRGAEGGNGSIDS